MTTKIKGTEAAWDSRRLGNDRKHVKVASAELSAQIDAATRMQPISIRLDIDLIDTFKQIGEYHGVGYQPLMRDALRRFADHEMKSIIAGLVESQRKSKPAAKKVA